MAKTPDVYYQPPKNYNGVTPVSNKPGYIARLARKLYKRFQTTWLFNLGYKAIEIDYTTTPIGEVVDFDDNGNPVIEMRFGGYDD